MATLLKCMNQYRISISQTVGIRGIQAFFESYTSKFKRPLNHFELKWRWMNMVTHHLFQPVVIGKALNVSVSPFCLAIGVVLLFAYKNLQPSKCFSGVRLLFALRKAC